MTTGTEAEILELRRALELDAADLWRVTNAVLDECNVREQGLVGLEGKRLVEEAIAALDAIRVIVKKAQAPASTRFLDVMRRTDDLAKGEKR